MRIIIIAVITSVVAVGLYARVRFTDNGDGTVTDHGTGLVWQKCSYGQGALDCSGATGTRTWQEALQYCRNLPLAGRSWRLPNVNEIKSIVDYSTYNPVVNTALFPNTRAAHYWSSSTYVTSAANAWDVDFLYGMMSFFVKTNGNFVRCVADGP